MKRVLGSVAALAAIAALAVAVSASGEQSSHIRHHGNNGHGPNGKTITVIEHATTDETTDTGAKGDSAGDILTFANDVFDKTDAHKVGTDQGYCIRTVKDVAYECNFTTMLQGGSIVVEGPFYDAKDSVLAITGGTGRYRKARGAMELRARENGTKFAFVFHIVR